jgi:radical SAM superfamily enzyme YgiQ (UPF0313 family)
MRVLLIATNRHDRLMSRMVARPLPIGLAYVAGALAASQHEVKILDLMFSADYLGDVERAVQAFQPSLVGISIRNLGNHSYLDPQWALPTSKAVIDTVRSLTNATIVCGGPAFSMLPQAIFAYMEPDLGIAGDAAEAFAQLANDIESGALHHDLPGLVYRQDGEIVVNGGRCALPLPFRRASTTWICINTLRPVLALVSSPNLAVFIIRPQRLRSRPKKSCGA